MAKKRTAKIIDFYSYSGYIVNNSINEEEKVKKKDRKEKNKVNRSNSKTRRTKNN